MGKKFVLVMSIEGDAFDPEQPTAEVRAVLLRVATGLLADPAKERGVCRTSKQTIVGEWVITEELPIVVARET
jgi:hypothetical protein